MSARFEIEAIGDGRYLLTSYVGRPCEIVLTRWDLGSMALELHQGLKSGWGVGAMHWWMSEILLSISGNDRDGRDSQANIRTEDVPDLVAQIRAIL